MDNKGFTLLETTIVLVIVTIFVLFALTINKHLNSQKLNAAAAMIAEDIRLTQQLNMKQDGLYTIIFDFVNERYYIRKHMVIYKKVNLPGGIDLVYTNFDFDNNPHNGPDHRLSFNTRGEPIRANGVLIGGHLSLKDNDGNTLYVIVASITGRVRIDTSPPP
ncbi:MAG TPA: prepilin-type N-terminal cleavage/methylation domain-containing protein [Bacillota bacterium]|nr:prepilin-type N-terminal cleavage/methylation domain-containing protein [Bacillota bacterium]